MLRILVAGSMLLAACGGNTASSGAATTLTVSVVSEGTEPQEFTLACGAPPSGTAPHLATREDAERACATVEDPANRRRLVGGPDQDRVCTQIYGGPQVAEVRGTVRDEPVETNFHRADGCGITDWETFEAFLGPADQPFVVEG